MSEPGGITHILGVIRTIHESNRMNSEKDTLSGGRREVLVQQKRRDRLETVVETRLLLKGDDIEQQQLQQQHCTVRRITRSIESTNHIIRCATRRVSKKSVARKSPLRFEYSRNSPRVDTREEKRALFRVIDRDLTDQERLREVNRQIERARVLPKASSYARHKLQVLEKAKSLLEQRIGREGSCCATTIDGDEQLNRLLEELSIE